MQLIKNHSKVLNYFQLSETYSKQKNSFLAGLHSVLKSSYTQEDLKCTQKIRIRTSPLAQVLCCSVAHALNNHLSLLDK